MSTSTLIASGTRLTGEVSGDGDVTVAGLVDGTIDLEESLTVASDGFVQGEIRAGVVTVEGAVDGTIEATQSVVLTESARVVADIETPNLIIDKGAQLSGDIEVTEGGDAPSGGRTRRSSRSGSRRGSSSTSTSTTRSRSTSTTSSSTSSRSTASSTPSSSSASESSSATSSNASDDEASQTTDETDESDEQNTSSESSDSTDTDDSLSGMEASEIADSYTVRELRDELRKRDLTVRGKKSTLVQRLVEKAGLGQDADTDDDTSED
jgi:cytoskeletal protein CcmA (bactofilin family)